MATDRRFALLKHDHDDVYVSQAEFDSHSHPGNTYDGVMVTIDGNDANSPAGQSITSGADTKILLNTVVHGDATLLSSNNITLPTGTTKVRLTAGIEWETDGTTGYRHIVIKKNAAKCLGCGELRLTADANDTGKYMTTTSGTLEVVDTDTFALYVTQTSSATLNALDSLTWLELEVIE